MRPTPRRCECPHFGDTLVYTLSSGVPANRREKSQSLPSKQPLQQEPYRSLVRLLSARASELGLSVRALAERLDRPRTTVHKTLTGQRRMDPIEFLVWCDALEWDDPVAILRPLSRR